MVNLGKRLRKLKPQLLQVRAGYGACLIPSLAQKQLTKIHLVIPHEDKLKKTRTIRHIWRHYLPSLKYHNPELVVTIDQPPSENAPEPSLTLHFAGSMPKALAVEQQVAEDTAQKLWDTTENTKAIRSLEDQMRRYRILVSKAEDKKRRDEETRKAEAAQKALEDAKKVKRPFAEPSEGGEGKETNLSQNQEDLQEILEQERVGTGNDPKSIEALKARSERQIRDAQQQLALETRKSSEESQSSQIDITNVVYGDLAIREVYTENGVDMVSYTKHDTFNTQDAMIPQIWSWFQRRTGSQAIQANPPDATERVEIRNFNRKADVDRKRVAKILADRRREKEMLAQAKGEVEKLKADP